MSVSVHVGYNNGRVEIAHHCGRVGALSKIAVAGPERHCQQTKPAELHGVETSVLVHVAKADDQRTVVVAEVRTKRKSLPCLVEIRHEEAFGISGDDKIYIAVVVQVACGDPGGRNYVSISERDRLWYESPRKPAGTVTEEHLKLWLGHILRDCQADNEVLIAVVVDVARQNERWDL